MRDYAERYENTNSANNAPFNFAICPRMYVHHVVRVRCVQMNEQQFTLHSQIVSVFSKKSFCKSLAYF